MMTLNSFQNYNVRSRTHAKPHFRQWGIGLEYWLHPAP
jgi:hypothetical protein